MKKRILVCLLIITLVISTITPIAYADSISLNVQNYIEEVVPMYLSAGGVEVNAKIMTTQGYQIEGNPNSYIYFILLGNSYIGRLVVNTSTGKPYSSFVFDDNPEINKLIISKEPFRVATISNKQILLTAQKCVPITGTQAEIAAILHDYPLTLNYRFTTPSLMDIDISNTRNINVDASEYYAAVNLPHVDNQQINDGPNQDVWLCWAACVCSIGRFRGGPSLTASQLYYQLKNQYGGYPTGTSSWVKKGYAHFNMNNIGYYSTILWSKLYSQISINQPVTFVIESAQGSDSHAIVCEAFMGGNNSAIYRFMDPNEDSKVYIYSYDSDLAFDDFYYHPGYGQFDRIIGYYYSL